MWALPKLLSKYVDYYNRTRTHLSLTKNPPEHRTVQRPTEGRLVEVPRVGGLHHEYLRRAGQDVPRRSVCTLAVDGSRRWPRRRGSVLAPPGQSRTIPP